MANNTSGLHGEFEKERVTLWSGNCAYGSTIEVPNLDKYKRISVYVEDTGEVFCDKSGIGYYGTSYFNINGNPYITCAELKISGNTVTNNGCGHIAFTQLTSPSNNFKRSIINIIGLPY